MSQESIGIDIGGTSVKAVRLNSDGATLQQLHLNTGFDIEDQADQSHWCNVVREAFLQLDKHHNCPVAISAPGLPAKDGSRISIMPGRFPGLEGFDWRGFLEQPNLTVLNDARAALMAELAFGAAVGVQDVILLTLGTGVGGAIAIGGEFVEGRLNRAGHLGHISLDVTGEVGITGIPGSLEMAIGNATVSDRSGGKYNSTLDLISDYESGVDHAKEVWLRSVRDLSIGLSGLINVISPERIVLGGGIARAGDSLLTPLKQYMDEYEWRPDGTATDIVFAKYQEYAGAVGAAAYALKMNRR